MSFDKSSDLQLIESKKSKTYLHLESLSLMILGDQYIQLT